MSDAMPTGWMSADEARKWARRGVWAWRYPDADECGDAAVWGGPESQRAEIRHGESWRYIGPHPDDPADVSGLVELEAWCVISNDTDGADLYARAHNSELAALTELNHNRTQGRDAKIVRLTGYTAPPTREPVEVVAGEVTP